MTAAAMEEPSTISAVGPAAPPTRAAERVPPPTRTVLIGWLLRVTRPVLAPLLCSTLCRVADLLLGVGLFALGAHAVVSTGTALASGGPVPSPWTVLGAMVVMSLAKGALRYGEQFTGHFVAFKALELLRGEIFRALIPRAPRVSATSRSGDLLARATKDVDRIEVFFAHTIAPVVSAVVVPVTVLVAIGAGVSWELAAVALPFLLGALAVVPLAGRRHGLASARRTAEARAALTQHVTDSIQGLSEIVGYGRADERLAETAALDDDVARAGRPAAVWAAVRRCSCWPDRSPSSPSAPPGCAPGISAPPRSRPPWPASSAWPRPCGPSRSSPPRCRPPSPPRSGSTSSSTRPLRSPTASTSSRRAPPMTSAGRTSSTPTPGRARRRCTA